MAVESRSASEPAELAPLDPSVDHFARLGLARAWQLDRDALERNYLAGARVVHPDRFASSDSATRRLAMEHSAALNEAYRVLRDPVLRAEYLVELAGIDLDSSDKQSGAPHPSQAFLIEMIELREQLEDAQPGQLDALHEQVEERLDESLSAALAALDADRPRDAAIALVHRRYLQRFIDEVEQARA